VKPNCSSARLPRDILARCSAEQLLEHVWGYDYAGETRTVDVHVHWLRTAIEPEPASPVIVQTVRGVGYVLRRPA
jgi:DNA-binding response OmpR family regulator